MKKFFLLIVCLSFCLCGCGELDDFKSRLSEIHFVYYTGETEHYKVWCSSGKREDTYQMDGKASKLVDFLLLSVEPKVDDASLTSCALSINGKTIPLNLEKSPYDSTYACDLGVLISGEDNLQAYLSYLDLTESVELVCESKTYKIQTENALKLAFKEFYPFIKDTTEDYEMYLKIISSQKTSNIQFWYARVLFSSGQERVCVIEPSSGEILVSK